MKDQLLRPSSTGSIGLIWWGSWSNGATIGDLLVLKEVIELLEKEDLKFTVFSAQEIENIKSVPLAKMEIKKVTAVIFVCGPIVLDFHPLRDLVSALKSSDIPFIGVNVSILSPLANPFSRVIAREGHSISFFDLSPLQQADGILKMHLKRKMQVRKIKVGIALRGHQSEYGVENCNCEKARELVDRAISILEKNSIGVELCNIAHTLSAGKSSMSAFDQVYQQCDFVLTTRFHGAIMAIRNLIPFVAIDQIQSGAKVSSLLRELCPNKVINVDFSAQDLANEIQMQLNNSLFLKLLLLRKARRLARVTRREITRLFGNLAKGH